METTALKAAISYESKLVRRNWLFYFFILGVLCILGILVPWERDWLLWKDVVFASSMPLRGIYFLNLFQSLIVTFIICDITRKQRKAETREVLSARPIGNEQSLLGGFLGVLIPFLVVDVIFMIACVLINIAIPDSPVNLWVYLFYLLTRVLPSLVFITGLSLFVNRLVKLSFISWFILIGFLYFSYSFLITPLHGVLDFRGSLQTDVFSTMIGFTGTGDYLLQRGAFLLLGISLFYFSVSLMKRLPEAPRRKPYFIISATLLLVFSFGLGYIYINKFQTRLNNRIAYREAFLAYNEYPTARVLTHDLVYRPGGDQFSVTSRMSIQNQKKVKMDQFLLFLNPGLKINKIESDGQNIPFRREHQIIIIERPLVPGECIELAMDYEGGIDEDVYQINVSDENFFSFDIPYSYHENYGKRRAFVSNGFTLLVPEVMWYPTTVPPVEFQASKEINFTSYTLHVENSGGMTVLSQGEPMKEGDNVTFNNLQDLTELTLCMGKYEKRAIAIDSIAVEFYTYPGNDFYMNYFDEWEALKKDNPNREKKLTEISKQCKDIIEEGKPNPYPFKYLKLVEVPASLYLSGSYSFRDNVQPEIALFGERLYEVETTCLSTFTGQPDRGISVQDFLLTYKIPFILDRIGIGHIFSDYSSSLTSDTYQGIDQIFRQMMNPKEIRGDVTPKMINRIAEKGLEGIITEGYSREQSSVISLKVSYLLGYLTTITTWDSLTRFMQEFNASTRFREVNFDSFIEGFEQRFGQNIKAYMDEWYTGRRIPLLTIKDETRKTTEDTQIIDFKVGNFGETDGIVSLITRESRIGGATICYRRSYLIKPRECKRIIMHEDIEDELRLSTNFSGNFPKDISFNHGDSPLSGSVPSEEVTLLERNQFYRPGEIIVDNGDENFHLIDSADNRKRLTDLLKKGDEREYLRFSSVKANEWSLAITQEFCGDHIRGAFVKKAGSGKFKAEWVANLPEAGKYEIFIYRPHLSEVVEGQIYATDHPRMKSYYAVYTAEGKEEIVLEVQEGDWLPTKFTLPEEEAWVSLGRFTLPEGESRVVLNDRGVAPIEVKKYRSTYFQMVVADAVKWVKVK